MMPLSSQLSNPVWLMRNLRYRDSARINLNLRPLLQSYLQATKRIKAGRPHFGDLAQPRTDGAQCLAF
jgi:hypothetical protein